MITKDDVVGYIKQKIIPLSLINSKYNYHIKINFHNYTLVIEKGSYIWEKTSYSYDYSIQLAKSSGRCNNLISFSDKSSMDKPLSDFIYWFEINKSNFKYIEYSNKPLKYIFKERTFDDTFPSWVHNTKKNGKRMLENVGLILKSNLREIFALVLLFILLKYINGLKILKRWIS